MNKAKTHAHTNPKVFFLLHALSTAFYVSFNPFLFVFLLETKMGTVLTWDYAVVVTVSVMSSKSIGMSEWRKWREENRNETFFSSSNNVLNNNKAKKKCERFMCNNDRWLIKKCNLFVVGSGGKMLMKNLSLQCMKKCHGICGSAIWSYVVTYPNTKWTSTIWYYVQNKTCGLTTKIHLCHIMNDTI